MLLDSMSSLEFLHTKRLKDNIFKKPHLWQNHNLRKTVEKT
ncbi:unnamed protein product [Brassica rapa]|uniref:Uncharacterized protein n=1 Tax=Brassica campestris TaxID=3711 RepID=A0A3P6BMV3_BRACM|nr:unnamed protein product [Brassica rapa]VDD00305.1 unnamed protein product [Brassica rapa]